MVIVIELAFGVLMWLFNVESSPKAKELGGSLREVVGSGLALRIRAVDLSAP